MELTLNEINLKYIFSICNNKPLYKVGVFVAHLSQIESIYEKIMQDNSSDNIIRVYKSQYKTVITMKNQSTISIMTARENVRGSKFNSIVVDDTIQSEIVLYVLRRCITTYNLELSEKLLNNAYEVKKLKELEEDLK